MTIDFNMIKIKTLLVLCFLDKINYSVFVLNCSFVHIYLKHHRSVATLSKDGLKNKRFIVEQ